jgi:hypothetical protein
MSKILAIIAISLMLLAGTCKSKADSMSVFKCGRILTEKELVRLSKSSYKDYDEIDFEKLAALTALVNEMSGDSIEHEVFFREKSPKSLTMEVFGVEAPVKIENIACAIFQKKDLKLPAEQKILFHKYLDRGANSKFLIGLANK